jgi:hypothetical protein
VSEKKAPSGSELFFKSLGLCLLWTVTQPKNQERFRTMINIKTMFCQENNTRPARMGINVSD